MTDALPPGLYLVATPIGNLGDLGARAAETLRRADRILAEDTRVTAKLLAHIGAKVPMSRYDDHSTEPERQAIVERLGTEAVALVSDAGTPLISDPGYKLVRAARRAGHEVRTVPGPCAAIAALTVAGLPTDRFLFLGFLPPKAKARAEAIAEVSAVQATLILYESGPRLGATLKALATGLGDRQAAVTREISKKFEQCVAASLTELAERYAEEPPKGEIAVVIAPPGKPALPAPEDADVLLRDALARMPAAKAAGEVARATGLNRRDLYARAMAIRNGGLLKPRPDV